MNLEEHLKQMLGNIAFQVAQQSAVIDEQSAKITQLEAELATKAKRTKKGTTDAK